MPSRSKNYKAKKRAVYRRNQATKARLIAEGMTPEQAQEYVNEAGRITDAAHRERLAREHEEFKRIISHLPRGGATQPENPQSVRSIPAGLPDSNRKRH